MARMLFLRDIDADVQLRCRACGHGGVLPRAMLERRFGPNYPVLSIAPHYRCSRCDSRDIESRPIPAALPAASFEAANEDPSFDAPLAALNGLLASLRGGGPVAEAQSAPPPSSPPPPPPSPPAAAARSKPLSELPLSDLVADGPGDGGAAPLWEPVSLADMAARLGAIRADDDDTDRDGEPDGVEPVDGEPDVGEPDVGEAVDGGWDDPAPPAEPAGKEAARNTAPLSDPDEDEDETLAAMRLLLAQAHWSEDDEPDDRPPAAAARYGQPGTAEDIDGQAEDEPPVFSHKVLVRRDFEEDWTDPDSDRWRAEDDRDEADGFDGDEEPSDEEILSFAIRDPEKPAASPAARPADKPSISAPPPPADEPLDFDQHRAERRAQRPPPPPEDEEVFDRTLAALRSMIEDAANDPDDDAPPPPRKSPAMGDRDVGKEPDRDTGRNPARASGWQDEDTSGNDPFAGFDADPAPDQDLDPDRDPAPAARRSTQEREIEEAMKALRGLIEEEVTREPPPPAPAPPPKPRAGKPRPPPRVAPATPPGEEAEPAAKQAADKAVDPTPLSKTIAALRGMLELDGKRKR
ncbi:hypothetical protein DM194_11415 [Azospirillum ramasamyi]|uniref:Uncharacterized protein n=2 Tax=Azospirillum ramasamyi TaxID=682998 RepID=A0A2U9S7E8_9PROT|nr:hypothetical protein DM194_11415 [Azospirillum ramasamyi]